MTARPRTGSTRARAPLLLAALAALAGALPACQRSRERAGDVDVVVVPRAAPGDPAVAAAWVRVTGATAAGAPYDTWVECVREPEHLEAELEGVPPGSYRVHGKAFAIPPADPAAAEADYESPTDPPFDIAPGVSRLAVLVLDRFSQPGGPGNRAPRVDGVVAGAPTIDTSRARPVAVAASASDPDGAGDVAGYSWTERLVPATAPVALPLTVEGAAAGATSTGATGTFTSTDGATTAYQPPAGFDGVALLTVTVTDQQGAMSAVTVPVVAKPSSSPGALAVTALVNVFPELRGLATSAAQLGPGGSTTVSATALDADGDPLSYAWSDGGCGGTFAAPTAASTRWTAPPASGFCTLSVTVEDLDRSVPPVKRGGRVAGTLGLSISAAAGAYAPAFTLAAVAPASAAAPGRTLWFLAQAVDPRPPPEPAAPISAYAWSDGAGGAFTPVLPGDLSYVAWTAPPCGAATAPVPLTVTATATGSAATTPFAFPVTLLCP